MKQSTARRRRRLFDGNKISRDLMCYFFLSIHINSNCHPSNTHCNNHQKYLLTLVQIDIRRRHHRRTLMTRIENPLLLNMGYIRGRIIPAKIHHGRWPVQQHGRVIDGMANIADGGWSRYCWRYRTWGVPWRVTDYWTWLCLRSFSILMMVLFNFNWFWFCLWFKFDQYVSDDQN